MKEYFLYIQNKSAYRELSSAVGTKEYPMVYMGVCKYDAESNTIYLSMYRSLLLHYKSEGLPLDSYEWFLSSNDDCFWKTNQETKEISPFDYDML